MGSEERAAFSGAGRACPGKQGLPQPAQEADRETDERFMREALRLAQEAAAEGEVPVGAVVVRGGEIVGRGRNRRERGKTALAHAGLEAIAGPAGRWGAGGCGNAHST